MDSVPLEGLVEQFCRIGSCLLTDHWINGWNWINEMIGVNSPAMEPQNGLAKRETSGNIVNMKPILDASVSEYFKANGTPNNTTHAYDPKNRK